MKAKEYVVLTGIIDFNNFDYGEYRRDEVGVLQPQLEEIGFTDVNWGSGEADSFGPLTRVCKAKDGNGNTHYFIYG